MTDEEPEIDLWRGWCTLWGFVGLVVLLAAGVGLASAALGIDVPTQDSTDYVAGEAMHTGDDFVADVQYEDYGKLQVNFTQSAGEAGVSKIYLYEKGTNNKKDEESLDPLQRTVETGDVDLEDGEYRFVAVNGSNQPVYDGVFYVREIHFGPSS